jgi:3-methyladenine DNA glycosylase AlkD
MKKAEELKKKLWLKKNKEKAEILQRFFKTGKGEYGENDVFWGVSVPEQRKIVKDFYCLELKELEKLLNSKIHEHRLSALIVLIEKYKKTKKQDKQKIFNFYLKNLNRINNWDLVDISAPLILGDYLLDKKRNLLYKLAQSENLWERRVAVVSTLQFIRNNNLKDVFLIAQILLKDKHDLIHKATGWMLREAGKKCQPELEKFLIKHKNEMPRTMLRYSIEKFSENKRKKYLK